MPRDVLASQLMVTDVLTLAPSDKVHDAMVRLVERDVDAAPVVDPDGRVVGILSTGDLIVQETRLHMPTVISLLGATLELPSAARHFDRDLQRALGATVGEVMTKHPVTCRDYDNLEQVATLLHDHDISRLPVLDADDRLVGIVSRGDVVRAILRDAGS
jgi:CBS domain-containing protein